MFSQAFLTAITTAAAVVIAITQVAKRLLRLRGAAAIGLSILVSAIVSLPQLDKGAIYLILYTLAVAACANGFKKVFSAKSK